MLVGWVGYLESNCGWLFRVVLGLMIWWVGFGWVGLVLVLAMYWFGGLGFAAKLLGFWFGFGWVCWFSGSVLYMLFGLRVSDHTFVLFGFGVSCLV